MGRLLWGNSADAAPVCVDQFEKRSVSREKYAVFLPPEYGNEVSAWVRRLRSELEAGLFGGPLDRSVGLKERTLKALSAVMDGRGIQNAVPLHVKGNHGASRKDRRDVWKGESQATGKAKPLGQRVR